MLKMIMFTHQVYLIVTFYYFANIKIESFVSSVVYVFRRVKGVNEGVMYYALDLIEITSKS